MRRRRTAIAAQNRQHHPTIKMKKLLLYFFLVGSFLLAGNGAEAVKVPPDTPLNRVPFVMTHDTATGYLGDMYGLYENSPDPETILIGWTKTQVGSVTDQINCGARAFDMRPYLTEDNRLIAHHGGILVDYPLKDMMQEMVDWANENPEEFLLPEIAHCSGDTEELKEQCDFAARDVLTELGIPFIFNDTCPEAIKGLTLGDAMEKGKLEGGGHLLAVWSGCWLSNYDPTRNCHGYEFETAGVSRKFNCWINSTRNPEYAVNNIMEYLDETYQAGPPEDGRLWQMQALWQSVQESVMLGTTWGSSLLIDIKYSRLNRFMFENLTEGRWGEQQGVDGVNMFEVDFVCDQGENIFMTLDPSFGGNWTDFPDDVIINNTGIGNIILEGGEVIFYNTPANYSAPKFRESSAIRRMHRSGRWGKTKDIVEFFNGDEDKQQEYLVGILGWSIFLWCILIIWAIFLVWAKWSNKLKWCSGTPPPAPTPKTVEGGDQELPNAELPQMKKYRLRTRRIRITVLCCGVLILIMSVCVIAIGFTRIRDALNDSGDSIDRVQVLLTEAREVTDDYLIQANQTQETRVNFLNALVFNCNFTSKEIDEDTGLPVNVTEDLIELNGTLANFTAFYDQIESINRSLDSISRDVDSISGTVDDMATSILMPMAVGFIVLFDVVVIVFMVGVILAWKKKQPRLFRDCTSKAAIPLFLLLLVLVYVVTSLALVAATLAADFCKETPDNQIVRIIDASAPFDEFIEYYIRGCNPDLRPEMLFDLFRAVEFVLVQIGDLLKELSELDPSELPCTNPEFVLGELVKLKDEYVEYVDMLYRLGIALGCDRINPIYGLLAYNTGCVTGFNTLAEIFAFLLVIGICSMTIVTLRVAWYETDDAADEKAHIAGDGGEEQYVSAESQSIENGEMAPNAAEEEDLNGENTDEEEPVEDVSGDSQQDEAPQDSASNGETNDASMDPADESSSQPPVAEQEDKNNNSGVHVAVQ